MDTNNYTKKNQYQLALAKLHCDHKNAKWQRRAEGDVKVFWCPDCEETIKTEGRIRGFSPSVIQIDESQEISDSVYNAPLTIWDDVEKKLQVATKHFTAGFSGFSLANHNPKMVRLLENDFSEGDDEK